MTQAHNTRSALVRVNEHCAGLGTCVSTAPELFRLDGDRAVPPAKPVNGAQIELVEEAVEGCPMQAVEVRWSEGVACAPADDGRSTHSHPRP
jgi:ferredoxin